MKRQNSSATRRWLIVAGALVVVALAGWIIVGRVFAAQSTRSTSLTASVTTGDIQQTVLSSAQLQPAADLTLTFGTAGTLSQLKVKPGDHVTKGQLIAALDDTDLNLAVTQAQANLTSAQAKLDSLKAPLTPAQLSAAKLKVTQAQDNLTSAQQKLDALKAGPTQAQISAAKLKLSQAQQNLDKAKSSSALQVQQAQLAVNSAQRAVQDAQDKYNVTVGPLLDSKGNLLPNLTATQIASYDSALHAVQDAKDNQTKAQLALQDAQNQQTQNVNAAQAQLDDANVQYQASIAGPTQSDLQAAQLAVDQAQAQLNDANTQYQAATAGPSQTDLEAAQASVEQAQVSLDSAKLKLQSANLTAPFTGVVVSVPVVQAQTVGANTTIAELVDESGYHLDMNVSESDIQQVKPNQPVDVSFDALGGTVYTGTVTYVSPVATVQQGVVSYLATVTIDPKAAGPNSDLKPGMSATASVIVAQHTNVLLVPNRAIRTEGRQKVVYIEGPNAVQVPVVVQTGISDATNTEIVGDTALRDGDTVVIPSTTTTTGSTGTRIGGGGLFGGFGGGGGR